MLAFWLRQDLKCQADLGGGSLPDRGRNRFKRREVPPLHVLLLEIQGEPGGLTVPARHDGRGWRWEGFSHV